MTSPSPYRGWIVPDHVKENLSAAEPFLPLSEAEKAVLDAEVANSAKTSAAVADIACRAPKHRHPADVHHPPAIYPLWHETVGADNTANCRESIRLY